MKYRTPKTDQWGIFRGFDYWGMIDGKFIHPCTISTDWDNKRASIIDWENVDKSEQYTGLKDKNGKEIYFNSDKVRAIDNTHDLTFEGYIDNSDPYCIMLRMDDGDEIPLHVFAYDGELEIIGNIHENNNIIDNKK